MEQGMEQISCPHCRGRVEIVDAITPASEWRIERVGYGWEIQVSPKQSGQCYYCYRKWIFTFFYHVEGHMLEVLKVENDIFGNI